MPTEPNPPESTRSNASSGLPELAAREPASSKPRFIRAVGLLGLTAIAVNGVIGSGIFVLPANVASLLGSASPFAYLVAAFVIALTVLCFAETGGMFGETGGPYVYAREAFGKFVGFEVGWMFVLSRLAASAAISNAFVSYLGSLVPWFAQGFGRAVAITALLAALAWLNFVGVRQGARTVNILTVAKLIPLGLFVVAGLFAVDSNRLTLTGLPDSTALRRASLMLIFAFGGFENASVPAEETKNPTKSLPVALIASIVLTAVLYILIQVVAMGTLPGLAGDPTPLSSAARNFLGPAGALVIAIGAVISTTGSNSALVLVVPRVLYALGRDGQFPAVLARVHERYRTPHIGVIVFAVAAWGVALVGRFEELVALSAIARLLFTATTCLAVPVLRRKMPDAPRSFRVPGGIVIPVLAVAASGWLLTGVTEVQGIAGICALGAGLLFYFLVCRGRPSVGSSVT